MAGRSVSRSVEIDRDKLPADLQSATTENEVQYSRLTRHKAYRRVRSVPVAQLDRASASGAEGYKFEPCRGYFQFIGNY